MIDESVPVSESVIFIANISAIGISVTLHISATLQKLIIATQHLFSVSQCILIVMKFA